MRKKERIVSCQLRRTHPIGPIIFCNDLHCFEFCIVVSRREKDLGLDEVKGPYPTKGKHDDVLYGRSRYCFLCGKPIAKANTPDWSFKGMFTIHLQHKHPNVYESLKFGEVEYEDLFFYK